MGQQMRLAIPPAVPMPEDRLLKVEDVADMTALSVPEIYRRVRASTFPAAVRLGVRAVAWRCSAVQQWIRDLPPVELTPCPEPHAAPNPPADDQPPPPPKRPPKPRH